MRSKIIAVDFDGTLCENKWPEIGRPRMKEIEYVKDEQEKGAKIILWTCRTGELLDKAIEWCKLYEIYFDAVNANLPETIEYMEGDTRKIFADEYIDDKYVNIDKRKSTISFDDYLRNTLPDDWEVEEFKEYLEMGRVIYITGDERTGKSTLQRVLKKRGYKALDECEPLIIRLTKQIPIDKMIPNYYQSIE